MFKLESRSAGMWMVWMFGKRSETTTTSLPPTPAAHSLLQHCTSSNILPPQTLFISANFEVFGLTFKSAPSTMSEFQFVEVGRDTSARNVSIFVESRLR